MESGSRVGEHAIMTAIEIIPDETLPALSKTNPNDIIRDLYGTRELIVKTTAMGIELRIFDLLYAAPVLSFLRSNTSWVTVRDIRQALSELQIFERRRVTRMLERLELMGVVVIERGGPRQARRYRAIDQEDMRIWKV